MTKRTHTEIVEEQLSKLHKPRLPLSVVVHNIRSLHNVGSIFRTADGAGVEKIWLCGTTGYPPQGAITKTALGAEQHVDWEYRQDARGLIEQLRSQGTQIVLLEQTKGSVLYSNFEPHPPVCLVLGNEIQGVADDLVGLSDAAIEIPMQGIKNSLNVAVAFGIVAYHLRFKLNVN